MLTPCATLTSVDADPERDSPGPRVPPLIPTPAAGRARPLPPRAACHLRRRAAAKSPKCHSCCTSKRRCLGRTGFHEVECQNQSLPFLVTLFKGGCWEIVNDTRGPPRVSGGQWRRCPHPFPVPALTRPGGPEMVASTLLEL